ncbi:MAG TPA: EpsI family protein [Gammaproteobacteria bacterium]|nr:EpsI family protein [Gammaproteobacteria bacterium]
MTNLKLRYLIAAILIAATAAVVSALQYNSSQDEGATGRAFLQTIPMQIGEWKGYDVPLDEKVYEILETRAIINRNYVNKAGKTLQLSIVHYNDTKVDFHAPEACLGGRGEHTKKIVKKIPIKRDGNSSTLEIAEILASNPNSNNSVSYYFYKAGSFMGQNYIKMRLNIAKNRLFRKNKSGSLIRVSGYLGVEGSQRQEEKIIESFMQKLIPVING